MSYSVKTILKATGSVALVLALCVVSVLGLVGCGGDDSTATTQKTVTTQAGGTATTGGASVDASALVGKWYSEKLKETLEFTSDGKMTWTKDGKQPQTFPFSVEAGAIVFTQPNAPDSNNLPFTVSGNTLTTEDPKYGQVTYTKQ